MLLQLTQGNEIPKVTKICLPVGNIIPQLCRTMFHHSCDTGFIKKCLHGAGVISGPSNTTESGSVKARVAINCQQLSQKNPSQQSSVKKTGNLIFHTDSVSQQLCDSYDRTMTSKDQCADVVVTMNRNVEACFEYMRYFGDIQLTNTDSISQ